DITCVVNIQHNCIDSHCSRITLCPLQQERTLVEHQTKEIAQHMDTPLCLLSTHSIHSYEQIYMALPPAMQLIE
ncbi:hypothetical protein BC835DRAFT_1251940, partial [Cytidiella melzeri]